MNIVITKTQLLELLENGLENLEIESEIGVDEYNPYEYADLRVYFFDEHGKEIQECIEDF